MKTKEVKVTNPTEKLQAYIISKMKSYDIDMSDIKKSEIRLLDNYHLEGSFDQSYPAEMVAHLENFEWTISSSFGRPTLQEDLSQWVEKFYFLLFIWLREVFKDKEAAKIAQIFLKNNTISDFLTGITLGLFEEVINKSTGIIKIIAKNVITAKVISEIDQKFFLKKLGDLSQNQIYSNPIDGIYTYFKTFTNEIGKLVETALDTELSVRVLVDLIIKQSISPKQLQVIYQKIPADKRIELISCLIKSIEKDKISEQSPDAISTLLKVINFMDANNQLNNKEFEWLLFSDDKTIELVKFLLSNSVAMQESYHSARQLYKIHKKLDFFETVFDIYDFKKETVAKINNSYSPQEIDWHTKTFNKVINNVNKSFPSVDSKLVSGANSEVKKISELKMDVQKILYEFNFNINFENSYEKIKELAIIAKVDLLKLNASEESYIIIDVETSLAMLKNKISHGNKQNINFNKEFLLEKIKYLADYDSNLSKIYEKKMNLLDLSLKELLIHFEKNSDDKEVHQELFSRLTALAKPIFDSSTVDTNSDELMDNLTNIYKNKIKELKIKSDTLKILKNIAQIKLKSMIIGFDKIAFIETNVSSTWVVALEESLLERDLLEKFSISLDAAKSIDEANDIARKFKFEQFSKNQYNQASLEKILADADQIAVAKINAIHQERASDIQTIIAYLNKHSTAKNTIKYILASAAGLFLAKLLLPAAVTAAIAKVGISALRNLAPLRHHLFSTALVATGVASSVTTWSVSFFKKSLHKKTEMNDLKRPLEKKSENDKNLEKTELRENPYEGAYDLLAKTASDAFQEWKKSCEESLKNLHSYECVVMLDEKDPIPEKTNETIFLKKKDQFLTVYYNLNGGLVEKNLDDSDISHISSKLPMLGEQSKNPDLIKYITSKFGCNQMDIKISDPVLLEYTQNVGIYDRIIRSEKFNPNNFINFLIDRMKEIKNENQLGSFLNTRLRQVFDLDEAHIADFLDHLKALGEEVEIFKKNTLNSKINEEIKKYGSIAKFLESLVVLASALDSKPLIKFKESIKPYNEDQILKNLIDKLSKKQSKQGEIQPDSLIRILNKVCQCQAGGDIWRSIFENRLAALNKTAISPKI